MLQLRPHAAKKTKKKERNGEHRKAFIPRRAPQIPAQFQIKTVEGMRAVDRSEEISVECCSIPGVASIESSGPSHILLLSPLQMDHVMRDKAILLDFRAQG